MQPSTAKTLANRWAIAARTALLCLLLLPAFACAQSVSPPVVLDHVVAVVNNQAILASDIDDEIRLAVLDPATGELTPSRALEQLIGRALIQQQIRREEALSAEPSPATIQTRLAEVRTSLPVCVRSGCASEAGWKNFLGAHGLTAERVETYLLYRMQILGFIEERFRSGIRIDDEAIQSYYRDLLLPQYLPGEKPPTLESVAPRIEEILLQQHVNELFDGWLSNLRKEGEIEVMDPAYETPVQSAPPQEVGP